jgi:hypothetical protein
MRPVQIILILLFGGLTVYLEFRDIQEWTLFGGDLFEAVPFYTLCILTIVYLFKNSRQYRQRKSIVSYLPSTIGLLFLALTVGHMLLRSHYDNSPTLFTATNYALGSDGGFTLDFKKNHHLKGKKIHRLSSTTYWGTYRQQGDTFVLKIPLDFKIGRQAVFQDSILRFVEDTVKFEVSRQ